MDYKKISGKVEAIGQFQYSMKCHYYSYIRFLDETGNVITLKNVLIPNTVNSYIKVGSFGSFFNVSINKKFIVIFAFSTDARRVYDQEDIDLLVSSYRAQGIYFIFPGLPVSFVLIFFWGIGLIPMAICLHGIHGCYFNIPNVLNEKKLQFFLSEYGFEFSSIIVQENDPWAQS